MTGPMAYAALLQVASVTAFSSRAGRGMRSRFIKGFANETKLRMVSSGLEPTRARRSSVGVCKFPLNGDRGRNRSTGALS